jgi:hypothetical protein
MRGAVRLFYSVVDFSSGLLARPGDLANLLAKQAGLQRTAPGEFVVRELLQSARTS